jgi:hypothetical protein
MMIEKAFYYVICGTGSAGCILAAGRGKMDAGCLLAAMAR